MKIPKCMSTQHPDNVNPPFFAEGNEISGEDEIAEAYYVFSHLGCDEQMWDCEGKEVDNYVVKKLLTKYEPFFRDNKLGEDFILTLRVPNPTVEKAEAKILLETLESIPRSYDTARLFYGEERAPVFEVILPMAASTKCLDRIYQYYLDFVVGKQNQPFKKGDITIKDWIGEFKPENINVIPLFEDKPGMLQADSITRNYLEDKNVEYQRVFLARSDPAMNYGIISAVLLNKIALERFNILSEDLGIDIYPIIGMGSAPFRGNLEPSMVEEVGLEYPSAHTLTLQSSFKYDHPHAEVIDAINKLKKRKTTTPHEMDEEKTLDIIDRYAAEYEKQIIKLAPIINRVAKYVPSRRKRKLHIGLFGYSRSIGEISLPRAITFTCALYSLGIPPEVLGLNAITDADRDYLQEVYKNFDLDLKKAIQYLDRDSKLLNPKLKEYLNLYYPEIDQDHSHLELTRDINKSLSTNQTGGMGEKILRGANLRKFLG
ncbi:MAG: phosphoenolpyruvate carboxylase [Methanobacterium sp.]|nr:MAG: phosphoenolpyruvate carboxylase [Methanobacterium sp.]